MENKITISIWEYEQFIKASEKIRIIERLIEQRGYVSVDDVAAIIGTPQRKTIAAAEKAVENG